MSAIERSTFTVWANLAGGATCLILGAILFFLSDYERGGFFFVFGYLCLTVAELKLTTIERDYLGEIFDYLKEGEK